MLVPAAVCLAQVPSFEPPRVLDLAAKDDTHNDELPRIASGVGAVWVIVWQVDGAVDMGLGHDTDIVYSRSSDDGAHWSAPRPVSETFVTDSAEDRQPALATDGKGTWVVVWSSTEDLAGTSRRDRDIHYSVSTDNALTWSPPRNLNSNAATDWGDDEAADIATDGKGRWVVVWQSSDTLGNTKGGDRDILFAVSNDPLKSWTAPAVVDAAARNDTAFDTHPRIVTDSNGTWLVGWSSGGPSRDTGRIQRGVLVARSSDDAATWNTPQVLSGTDEDDRPDFGPRLGTDRRGNWICAWASSDSLGETIGRDRDILYVRSSDGGRTWTKRAPLNSQAAVDTGDDETPEIAVDGSGNWVTTWVSWDKRGGRGADADLLVEMSRDAGATWTPAVPLNTNADTDRGEDIAPSIATDRSGLWITAWSSTETFGEVIGHNRDILIASGRFGREIAGPPSNNSKH
ncbi:MAG TPA: sialidase family protein [Candidatus Binatia bacterium]